MGISSPPVTEVAGQHSPDQDEDVYCSRCGRECRVWWVNPSYIQRSANSWCIQWSTSCRCIQWSFSSYRYTHWLLRCCWRRCPRSCSRCPCRPCPAIVAPQPYSVHTGTKVAVAAEPVEQH